MNRLTFLKRLAAGVAACALLEIGPLLEPVETETIGGDISYLLVDDWMKYLLTVDEGDPMDRAALPDYPRWRPMREASTTLTRSDMREWLEEIRRRHGPQHCGGPE